MNLFANAWRNASADDRREVENAHDYTTSREAMAAGEHMLAGRSMRRIQTRNRLAGIIPPTDYARQLNAARTRYE